MPTLHLAQNDAADQLLSTEPLALVIGMVLDQQIPLEKAFTGPLILRERIGRSLDAADLADRDPDQLAEIFATPPAIHRFPGSMANRVQAVCRVIAEDYDNDAATIWTGVRDGIELRKRVKALPGFGEHKAKIFVALLGKQYDVKPRGWREAAGDFGVPKSLLSVADIVDANSLLKVRANKKKMKEAAKEAAATA